MASKSKRNRQRRKRKEALLAAPDVAITVAVKEKKMGGGIMVPPEREAYAAGALVQLLKKILKPLSADQRATRPMTRKQAAYAQDMTGAVVVAGGLGYAANSDQGQTIIEAADAGEIDVEIKNPDERINPDDFPTYEKGTDSAVAFQDAFRQAREARADTFEFEGRTYTADLPVNREEMNDGGLPTSMQIGQQKFNIQMKKEIKQYADLKELEDKYIQENDEERLKNVRLELENYKGSMAEDDYFIKKRREAREQKAEGGKFPDLTGDGKVTQADILKGRDVFQEGGMPVDTYPNIPPEEMAAAEASQLPDQQMEDEFIDYVLNEALQPEEQTYLMNALEGDPQLSMIFDKVVGTASEFTGSGEVEGPGTGVSDSIPARLSDGEFVMTRKATDQIGADRLQTMMDEAERAYDGGLMRKDEDTDIEDNMNKVMMSSNQMPSLNIRQR